MYRIALRMYNARNKIVHRGELSEEDEARSLALTREGASEAIECAAAILDWFGDPAPSFPNSEIVEFDFVRWGALCL
jgi:hypothetical protein